MTRALPKPRRWTVPQFRPDVAKQQTRRAEDARRQRLNEMRRQQQAAESRRRRLRTVVIAVAAAALGVGLVVLALVGGGHKLAPVKIDGLKTYAEKREHVTTKVDYPQTPPAGGPHNPVWLNCGIYDSPLPNENAVHDLEHGAVWITYRPELPAGQVSTLTALARALKTYVDVSPYPGLPAPVVVSAWGQQLQLPNASDPRLATFITAFRLSSNAPEPGAPCTGGTGTPTG